MNFDVTDMTRDARARAGTGADRATLKLVDPDSGTVAVTAEATADMIAAPVPAAGCTAKAG